LTTDGNNELIEAKKDLCEQLGLDPMFRLLKADAADPTSSVFPQTLLSAARICVLDANEFMSFQNTRKKPRTGLATSASDPTRAQHFPKVSARNEAAAVQMLCRGLFRRIESATPKIEGYRTVDWATVSVDAGGNLDADDVRKFIKFCCVFSESQVDIFGRFLKMLSRYWRDMVFSPLPRYR
jgi:hypothetical protein